MSSRRAAFLLLSWAFLGGPAAADELADFAAAAEKAQAHYRVALGYLRTENVDLAAREIERMREAWSAFTGIKPPAVLIGTELYAVATTDIAMRLVSAQMMIEFGRPDVAREAMVPIRTELTKLRRAAGISVLADCIADANAAMDALFVYDDRTFDWNQDETRRDIGAKAGDYGERLKLCDSMAPPSVHEDAQFRRLIDGAFNGLTFIPKAVDTRDGDLLHRVLGELRSFDNLLAFRFG
jgi:hypothetical protein